MPIAVVCEACGASYSLKNELAGQRLRCSKCQGLIVVPEAPGVLDPSGPEAPEPVGSCPAFHRDRFFINQKKFTIGEQYRVLDEAGQPLLFVDRPAHVLRSCLAVLVLLAVAILGTLAFVMLGIAVGGNQAGPGQTVGGALMIIGLIISIVAAIAAMIACLPRRHITIYTDEARTDPVLRITQDQKFSLMRAWYTVHCPEQGPLGRYMKNYLFNWFRKQWVLFDLDGRRQMIAKEDSMILSLLRRFLGPLFGLLRTNFIFMVPGDDRVIGEFNRKFSLFDKYVLDLSADRAQQLDRRLGVALAILLDTGERR